MRNSASTDGFRTKRMYRGIHRYVGVGYVWVPCDWPYAPVDGCSVVTRAGGWKEDRKSVV